jgi:hypothetical protein
MDQEKPNQNNKDSLVTEKGNPASTPENPSVKAVAASSPVSASEPPKAPDPKASLKKEKPKDKKTPKTPEFRSPSNEAYVKRRKRKRVALVVLAVSSVGVFTLGLVSFLGEYSGNFTVKMDNKRADLTMGVDPDFNRKTTYLKGSGLENAYSLQADDLPAAEKLDTEPFGAKLGTRTSTTHPDFTYDTYMAYTFLVKNVSDEATSFSVEFDVDQYNNPTNNAVALQDIARVRIYENLVTSAGETHQCNTYARKSSTPFTTSDGTLETRECISAWDYGADGVVRVPSSTLREENRGFATEFVTDNIICNYDYLGLESQAILRYTVCVWLEGWDPDCKGAPPDNASMTFSMHFEVL